MKTDRTISAKLFFIFLLYCIFIPSWHASAEDSPPGSTSTLTLYFENDTFYDTDRQYTSGMKLSWISPDLSDYRNNPLIPAWSCPLIERVPFLNKPGYQYCVSLSLGQSIYTPEDQERTDLITNDRPYAGTTYLAVGFHSKNDRQMDTLELDIGIVGRHSYAQDSQQTVHQWLSVGDPKGWKHQLSDEPILNAFFERKWRVLRVKSDRGFGLDVIPHIGCGAGNALTSANAGGQIRFGWNLPNDFGTFLIRPGSDSNAPIDSNDPRFFRPLRRFGVHLFWAVDGTAVAHNILLDGNTFRDSHSVEKEPFVANFIGGIGFIVNRFKITYSHVYQTKEFKTQNKNQQYGAISLSYTF